MFSGDSCAAVYPCNETIEVSTPYDRRSLHACMFPCSATLCKAVLPWPSIAFTYNKKQVQWTSAYLLLLADLIWFILWIRMIHEIFCYDFHIKIMLGWSLPPIVFRRALFLFTLFVYSGVQHISCCVFVWFSSSCVPYVASFSGLFIFDCPFGIRYKTLCFNYVWWVSHNE
jgi:hypothetical protein